MEFSKSNFVIVDVETTGLEPNICGVTEIALIKVSGKKIIDKYVTLVNPLMPIPDFITNITGISDAMVFDQPTEEEIAKRVFDFIGDSVLVAHNVEFDLKFVNRILQLGGIEILKNKILCTVKLARIFLPNLPNKNLEKVVNEFKINSGDFHRAESDAHSATEILFKFMDLAEKNLNIKNLDDFLNLQNLPAANNYRKII